MHRWTLLIGRQCVSSSCRAASRASKRLDYLAGTDLDLSIFQQLPLYVRTRVLKEGRVVSVRDEDALYEVAIRTAKQWKDFRPIYRMYLDEVARVDRDRILTKLDELDGYLRALRAVAPATFDEYQAIEKKEILTALRTV
jgi:hypothetical protein